MKKNLVLLMFAVFGMVSGNAQSPTFQEDYSYPQVSLLLRKQQQLQMTIEKIQKYFVINEADKDLFEEQVTRFEELSKIMESDKLNIRQMEKELSDIESQISSVQKAPAQLPFFDTWFINVPGTEVPLDDGMSTGYLGPFAGWGGEGPWVLAGKIYLATHTRIRVAVYIPKSDFFDAFDKRKTLQGYFECPRHQTDFRNYEKVYEFPDILETHKAADGDYYVTDEINTLKYSWDGISDIEDSLTHEKYPVFDCASAVYENADTGEQIYDSRGPADSQVGRYFTSINNSIKFSQTVDGVKADIWFAVGPNKPIIKDVTAFLTSDGCTIANLKWEDFRVSGTQAVTGAGWGENLKAYKSFPVNGAGITLENAEKGLYHITWELIKPDGKPYDSATSAKPDEHILGIIIEGVGPALNLTGKDGSINTSTWISIPRPKNVTTINNPRQSDNIKISSFPGSLLILTDEPASGVCKVYTIDGMEVLQQSLSKPATTIPLRAGIYVVEVQAGGETKTEKVYVSCNCGK